MRGKNIYERDIELSGLLKKIKNGLWKKDSEIYTDYKLIMKAIFKKIYSKGRMVNVCFVIKCIIQSKRLWL